MRARQSTTKTSRRWLRRSWPTRARASQPPSQGNSGTSSSATASAFATTRSASASIFPVCWRPCTRYSIPRPGHWTMPHHLQHQRRAQACRSPLRRCCCRRSAGRRSPTSRRRQSVGCSAMRSTASTLSCACSSGATARQRPSSRRVIRSAVHVNHRTHSKPLELPRPFALRAGSSTTIATTRGCPRHCTTGCTGCACGAMLRSTPNRKSGAAKARRAMQSSTAWWSESRWRSSSSRSE